MYWTDPPNEDSLTEYCTQCHGHSHSDNEVLVLRPKVTMLMHVNLCALTSPKLTFNRVMIKVMIGCIMNRASNMSDVDGI